MRRIVKYVLVPPSPPKVKGVFGKKLDELMLNINFIRLKDSCIE